MGVSSFVILPNIGAGFTALCVLLALVPCLVAMWKAPRREALGLIAPAIAYANLCGFMFGYHVHEKAALTVEIPMALVAVRSSEWGQQYVLLSTAAHVGIFPLLFQTQEIPIRWLLAVVYYIICVWGLSSVHMQGQGTAVGPNAAVGTPQKQPQASRVGAAGAGGSSSSNAAAIHTPSPVGLRTRRQLAHRQQAAASSTIGSPSSSTPLAKATPAHASVAGGAGGVLSMHQCYSWLPVLSRVYLAGLVLLELYCTLGHKVLLGDRLPFVPLMLTSVYCAVGITWVWGWMAWWFVQRC